MYYKFQNCTQTNYDNGEVECILLVDQETSIENIPPVRQRYKFILNTSIKRLLEATKQYALGKIVVIVIATKTPRTQYTS